MTRIIDFADGFTSSTSPAASATWTTTATQSIGAGGTITLASSANQILKVQGDGAARTASNTPFGTTPPSDGTMIRLHGQDNTNTLTITHNDAADGCILNGSATLGKDDHIELRYDSTADRYIEQSRNF